MKIGATSWLVVRGVALTATGFLAGAGMTFVCMVQNYLFALTHKVHDLGFQTPVSVYATFFTLMVVWVVIACVFAWRNRTRLGVTLSVIAFAVFVFSARHVLLYAYPVCNAF